MPGVCRAGVGTVVAPPWAVFHNRVASAAPPRPSLGPNATWSPDRALERLGGDEALVREMVALFVAEGSAMLEPVRASVSGGTADSLLEAAHALKGVLLNFTGDGPASTALALEQLARTGRCDGASALVDRLERELQILIAALRAFQESAPGCES